MSTEAWFRNPHDYIRELVECQEFKIAWDRGALEKRKIDPLAHAQLYYGHTFPWRLLLVGEQGTAEYRPADTLDRPTAVYPTWTYGDDAAMLEELVAKPVGEDADICNMTGVAPDELPVFGQEHRVLITGIPPSHHGPGRKFLRYLKELQEDYPNCIIHLHGVYAWRVAFGLGFGAADVQPREAASKGKVHLPSGSEVPFERVSDKPQWVTALGFKPKDLEVPRNRCMYNIRSAVWAGENYEALFNFRVRSSEPVDSSVPAIDYKAPITKKGTSPKKAETGDRYVCNSCSLSKDCKYFREGAVCSVPGAEPTELARFFKTRDSGMIIDGLTSVLMSGARRLEEGWQEERIMGERDTHVTKMQGQVFDQGVKLAKLLDPALRGGARVQVNVGGGSAVQVNNGSPNTAIGAVMRELQKQGIPLESITPEMIQGVFESMANNGAMPAAIEAKVIEHGE